MKYKIGEVGRILGISADLLRYYEKKGVVQPEKNPSNDYRLYDSWDVNFLLDCLWFKNIGFSIEQIAGIVRIPGVDALDALFQDKESELAESLRRGELLLRRTREQREDLERARMLLGRCEIAQRPALLLFLNRRGESYLRDAATEAEARRWQSAMPFNRRCFVVEGLPAAGREECRWGLSLGADYAEALPFPPAPPDTLLEPARCLHTVVRSRGRAGFTPPLLTPALDWAAAQSLPLRGEAQGQLLASVVEDGDLAGYFEVWLPLAE